MCPKSQPAGNQSLSARGHWITVSRGFSIWERHRKTVRAVYVTPFRLRRRGLRLLLSSALPSPAHSGSAHTEGSLLRRSRMERMELPWSESPTEEREPVHSESGVQEQDQHELLSRIYPVVGLLPQSKRHLSIASDGLLARAKTPWVKIDYYGDEKKKVIW